MHSKTSSTKMAFYSKSASMFLIMVLCLLFVMQLQSSGCNMGSGCFYVKAALEEMQNRKLLNGGKGNEAVFKSGVAGLESGGKGMKTGAGWELREAPLGPDPLHHHGGSPKKPKTP